MKCINGETIEVEIDGLTVTGIISFWHTRDITVEMIYPFKGIKHGCHIPVLGGNPGKDYNGENGIRKAKELLCEIYLDIKE